MSDTLTTFDTASSEDNKSLLVSSDRGFIGPNEQTPLAYFYMIEICNYGYLEANFEISRVGSTHNSLVINNSIFSSTTKEHDASVEKEIEDSLSTLDETIHALQNYRSELLYAIEKYKQINSANFLAKENDGV